MKNQEINRASPGSSRRCRDPEMRQPSFLVAIAVLAIFASVNWQPTSVLAQQPQLQTATFGGGCYWCVEAVFQRVRGVTEVRPGFMGGRIEQPTYEQVLTGRTGHVEIIQFKYDPEVVDFETLLQIFWKTHDPTTKNRQGPDRGPQYRSVVFYHSQEQRKLATEYKRLLNRKKAFRSPVVTSIEAASEFYPTKEDHLDYFNRNPDKQYCRNFVVPKLQKLQQLFSDKVKPPAESLSQ